MVDIEEVWKKYSSLTPVNSFFFKVGTNVHFYVFVLEKLRTCTQYEALLLKKKAQKVTTTNYVHQNKVTSQTPLSHVLFVSGILLISACKAILLNQLY